MTIPLYARLLLRESRGSRGTLALFVACLAVGVAAVVSVAALSDAVDQSIRSEARKLLAADLTVSGYRPLPDGLEALAAAPPRRATRVKELASMVAGPGRGARPGRSQLAELKVIDGHYPFYGELVSDPPQPLAELLSERQVVVAPDLLERLAIDIGGELRIGGQPFQVTGVVLSEPDRVAGPFTLGPRVFLSAAGLERAGLEQLGSRILHRLLIQVPPDADPRAVEALATEIRESLVDLPGYRVETHADAQPGLRQGVRRVERFLGLVALLSLLLGGVGAAQTTRSWLASRLDAIAILRCLGLRSGELLTLYLGHAVLLGLAGSLAGALLGLAAQSLAPRLIGDLLPVPTLSLWQPGALARGLGLGIGMALLFSAAPLMAVRRVPPLRVLRREVEPPRPSRWATSLSGAVLVAGIWLSAAVQADSLRWGAQFTAGLLAATAVLAALSTLLVRSLALARVAGPTWLRHGLASLARPGAATVGAIVALGIGVLLILGLYLVDRRLDEELLASVPEGAPTAFLIDIQTDQWPGVEALLIQEGATGTESVPVVTARLTAIGGRPVKELAAESAENRSRRWALTREQRLTYLNRLPEDNRVVEGSLWSDPDRPEVSVEQNFAADLGVGLGTRLLFDLQGVPLELVATSLRSVEWRSFGLNFFLVVEPGVLDEAPQYRVATTRLGAGGEQRVQDRLAADFPNVTLLKIRDFLDRIAAVLKRLATGVRFLGGFTVVAGLIILAGAVSAASVRRGREIALLKTLGMTRRGVAAMLATEYALTGVVAGLVGAAGGNLLAWSVLTRGLEMGWRFEPAILALAVAASVLLTALTGVAASWPALRRRPLSLLSSY